MSYLAGRTALSRFELTKQVERKADPFGKLVARDNSDMNRGDDVGAAYPSFKEAIAKNTPGSDVWTDKARGRDKS